MILVKFLNFSSLQLLHASLFIQLFGEACLSVYLRKSVKFREGVKRKSLSSNLFSCYPIPLPSPTVSYMCPCPTVLNIICFLPLKESFENQGRYSSYFRNAIALKKVLKFSSLKKKPFNQWWLKTASCIKCFFFIVKEYKALCSWSTNFSIFHFFSCTQSFHTAATVMPRVSKKNKIT